MEVTLFRGKSGNSVKIMVEIEKWEWGQAHGDGLSLPMPPQAEVQRRLELPEPDLKPGTSIQDTLSSQITVRTWFYLSSSPSPVLWPSCAVAEARTSLWLNNGVERDLKKNILGGVCEEGMMYFLARGGVLGKILKVTSPNGHP